MLTRSLSSETRKIENGMVRLRACALARRHAPLKSQPRKLRSPGASLRSGALPFQQRTNTSCYLAIPTHGFTVVLSVFGGTPPAKPLNCKSVSNRLGPPSRLSIPSKSSARTALRRTITRIRSVWPHHTGGTPRHSCNRFRLALSDILKTSSSFHSQFHLPFVLIVHRYIFRQQKTLLTFGKQGCRNPMFDSLPAYLSIIQTRFGGLPAIGFG